MMPRRHSRVVRYAAAAMLLACRATDATAPQASIRLELDAPFCTDAFPVQLWLDRVRVGVDTLRDNGAGTRGVSRAYSVSAGQHTVGARWVSPFGASYVWPDTVLTFAAGQTVTRTLPLYCS
jgi:hypothetical protein